MKEGSEVMPGGMDTCWVSLARAARKEKSQAGSGGAGGWGWKSREAKDKGRKECGIEEMRKGVDLSENRQSRTRYGCKVGSGTTHRRGIDSYLTFKHEFRIILLVVGVGRTQRAKL